MTGYDWKDVRRKLKHIIRTLLDLRYRLKSAYLEGYLIRVAKLFWPKNDHGMPVTEMNHRINQEVSEKIIKECVDDGHLVDIDSDDRHHLKISKKSACPNDQGVRELTK